MADVMTSSAFHWLCLAAQMMYRSMADYDCCTKYGDNYNSLLNDIQLADWTVQQPKIYFVYRKIIHSLKIMLIFYMSVL